MNHQIATGLAQTDKCHSLEKQPQDSVPGAHAWVCYLVPQWESNVGPGRHHWSQTVTHHLASRLHSVTDTFSIIYWAWQPPQHEADHVSGQAHSRALHACRYCNSCEYSCSSKFEYSICIARGLSSWLPTCESAHADDTRPARGLIYCHKDGHNDINIGSEDDQLSAARPISSLRIRNRNWTTQFTCDTTVAGQGA